MPEEKIVVIGSGCAGLTAAIYAARAGLNPLVIEGPQPGGQLTTTSHVENFPGFPENISGYELVMNMRQQAERFGARFLSEVVRKVAFTAQKKQMTCDGTTLLAKAVIIATGASARTLGIPGEKEFYGGKGVSTCATCDGVFYRHHEVIVIGGGDTACEDALFLTRFCSCVYLLHRRNQLRASKIMAERVTHHEKIRCLWSRIPLNILGKDHVESLQVQRVETQETELIPCRGIFLAIGHVPNTSLFQKILPLNDQGYLLGKGVETEIPGIFIAGDCADPHYRQAVTAAGMGCSAAIMAERYLSKLDYGN
ncbi:MAG: thioredoxin-disulfide reductase [Puniceicoccales bacterium]|jgi:thioredoxin reductase (NADPH)|nr:thioredoxin-disulfide reductase [Puniceicoccales bacterium]